MFKNITVGELKELLAVQLQHEASALRIIRGGDNLEDNELYCRTRGGDAIAERTHLVVTRPPVGPTLEELEL